MGQRPQDQLGLTSGESFGEVYLKGRLYHLGAVAGRWLWGMSVDLGGIFTVHNVVYFPCGVFQELCNKDLNCFSILL